MAPDRPLSLVAATPTRMKPAWAIAEYANMRLTSRWVIATTAPTAIVRIATPQTTGRHSQRKPPKLT